MFEFKMPQLGETVLEATITRWLKKEGDTVREDDPLVEVSTDKVDSEIPSPYSGVISRILFAEGETVAVGAVMVRIDSESERAAAPASPEPAPVPATVGTVATPVPEPLPTPAVVSGSHGVLSPLVRRLASEHGVNLRELTGTGSGGRITKQDVLQAAKRRTPADQAPVRESSVAPAVPPVSEPAPPQVTRAPGGPEEVMQVSPMRRTIAEHMVASVSQTARAWNTIEVDLSKVSHLRALAGPGFKEHEGFSLTWMPFVSMAVTQALLKFPQLNSTWNGDGTITRKHYVNLGIAVALDNGLIVPVIKHAEAMNLVGLARAVRDIADRARNKKLTPDDVQAGTFTITNPGGFGSIMSVPIINKGQTAILSFDAVVKRPVVLTDLQGADSIGIRQMTFLSMSWDHRIIDGAEAARFLAYLKSLLEEADFTADLSGLLST